MSTAGTIAAGYVAFCVALAGFGWWLCSRSPVVPFVDPSSRRGQGAPRWVPDSCDVALLEDATTELCEAIPVPGGGWSVEARECLRWMAVRKERA